jgi:hypothetical protein
LPFPALTEIKTERRASVTLFACMGNIIFKCPRTGLNVQHWLAGEPQPDNPSSSYESVTCNACGRLHFIDRASGKLAGEKEE